MASNVNPFTPAHATAPRVKAFVYGPTGAGKTRLSLGFPSPACIDLEKGTVPFAGRYPFDVLPAKSISEIEAAVAWLAIGQHSYRTLIIDPFTVFGEMLAQKWNDIFLKRQAGTKGFKFEFYELQPKDWSTLKANLKDFMRKLLALDMNIVCTAREKPLYAEGEFMRKIGVTWDGDKSLASYFDLVLRLQVSNDGKRTAVVEKDRWERLGVNVIDTDYSVIASAFGVALERPASPVTVEKSPTTGDPTDAPFRLRKAATEAGIKDADLLWQYLSVAGATERKTFSIANGTLKLDLSAYPDALLDAATAAILANSASQKNATEVTA